MNREPLNPEPAAFKPRWFLRNRWWFLPVLIVGVVLLFGLIIVGLVWLTGGALKESGVYQAALEKARAHPQVVAALGEPVDPGWYINGTVMDYEGEELVDLVILLRGPRAHGLLHAEAFGYEPGGQLDDLTLDIRKTGKRIFLQRSLPPHDIKLVKRLDKVMELAGNGRVDTAREKLAALAERYPDQPLLLLSEAAINMGEEKYAAARENTDRVLAVFDQCTEALHLRAEAVQLSGDHAAAVSDYLRLAELEPEEPWNPNNAAWILCTTDDEALRNGSEAIKWAEKATEMSERKLPGILDTLACAHAAAGNFERAVTIQEEAIALEQATSQREELQERLGLFKQGSDYRVSEY